MTVTHERIWGRVRIDLAGCWLWTGTLNEHGYGVIHLGGRTGRNYLVHRLVDELRHGPCPPGVHTLHRCDVPACVRPDHLWRGTQVENIADMDGKGRGRRYFEAARRLTPEQADEILTSRESSRALARRYPLSARGIRRLRERGGYRQGGH